MDLFPIMQAGTHRFIPWDFVSPHEAQAITNHGQTLETLARRGGLSPEELYAVLTDRPCLPRTGITNNEAMVRILDLIDHPDYLEGMYILATGDLDGEV